MTRHDPELLETAFVPVGTPSLADCLIRITSAPDLSPTQRRDLGSGLRRVAEAIGWQLDEAPPIRSGCGRGLLGWLRRPRASRPRSGAIW